MLRPLLATLGSLCAAAERLPLERFFLIVAGTAGLLLVLINPPFQGPDENAHYFRAVQVSEGTLVAQRHAGDPSLGGILPEGVNIVTSRAMSSFMEGKAGSGGFPFDVAWGRRVYTQFSNVAPYPPTSYLPQALGISAVRMLGGGPLLVSYGGRLANLVFYLALTGLAIRRIPFGRLPLCLVALLPGSVYQAATLSADTPMNAAAFLLLALALTDGRPSGRGLILRAGLGVILGLGKAVYFPLIAVGLMRALVRREDGWRRRAGIEALLIAFTAAVVAVWFIPHGDQVDTIAWLRQTIAQISGDFGYVVDRHTQLAFATAHPLYFLGAMMNTIAATHAMLIKSLIGMPGWWNVPMPLYVFVLSPLALALGLIRLDDDGWRLDVLDRAGLLVLAGGAVIGLYLVQYMLWTRLYAYFIEGVVGRYFTPILPPVLFACGGLVAAPTAWRGRILCACGGLTLVSLTTLIGAVIARYYIA